MTPSPLHHSHRVLALALTTVLTAAAAAAQNAPPAAPSMPGMPGMAPAAPGATPKPSTPPKEAVAPNGTVAVDPIRCWWRTDVGSIRTGETFTLVLTCAVLQTDAVQVVPDEARLGSNVIQMAPFDVVDGSHPADLFTDMRRFFQYQYVLRMINPDFIGHDVRVPDQVMHYRVNTKMEGNASLQGRDFSYVLPTLTMKVESLVDADAYDIRDGSTESFGTVESLGFRASLLRILAGTLAALGILAALLAIVRGASRLSRRAPKAEHILGLGAVLATAGDELAAVQRESEQGWSDALIGRALAAARIVAAFAIGRAPSQALAAKGSAGEGRLVRERRGGKATAVWSSTTANDLASAMPNVAADRRPLVEQLQAALTSLTSVQFGAAPVAAPGRAPLDAALSQATEAYRSIKGEYAWPRTLLRRWSRQESA